jgi:hypothetical protein
MASEEDLAQLATELDREETHKRQRVNPAGHAVVRPVSSGSGANTETMRFCDIKVDPVNPFDPALNNVELVHDVPKAAGVTWSKVHIWAREKKWTRFTFAPRVVYSSTVGPLGNSEKKPFRPSRNPPDPKERSDWVAKLTRNTNLYDVSPFPQAEEGVGQDEPSTDQQAEARVYEKLKEVVPLCSVWFRTGSVRRGVSHCCVCARSGSSLR